jgi:FkbM family methyltransferase
MQFIDLPNSMRLVMARHGAMLVNLNDEYMGKGLSIYGEYSQLECDFLLQWMPAARDAVEVGANIGCLSLPIATTLAARGRRLMAIEPQPVIFQQLCANLSLNHVRNGVALHKACAPQRTTLYFSRQDYDQAGNFGAVRLREQAATGDESIEALPLDDLLDSSWDVGLLKIDVEGMESAVLQGATKTIARCRPVIYLENDQPEKSCALIEQIWAMDYELWFHLPALFNPDNFAGHAENLYPTLVSVNMLCLPREAIRKPDAPAISDASWHPLIHLNT